MRVQENILPSIELLVLKRDGRKVSFEQDKIFSALRRANQELEHPVSEAGLKIVLEAVLADSDAVVVGVGGSYHRAED